MNEKNEVIISTSPNHLIELALKDNVDISKLEKLLELRDKWEAKEAAKSFKIAMVDFQRDKPELIKTKKADFGDKKAKYSYNPLPKIQKAIDPVLSDHGLSYRWEQAQVEGKVQVTCIISHIDGHFELNSLTGPHDTQGKNQIQAIGSSVSYLKRYTLEAALGLSSDEDDDGSTGPDGLPELNPQSDRWTEACEALLEGKTTISGIKKTHKLSDEIESNLWDLLHGQLEESFEKHGSSFSPTVFKDVERIIDNKETLSYKKALDLLTSAE